MNILRVLVVCLAFTACKNEGVTTNENEITLSFNESIVKTIKDKSWVVTFSEINENSLCPENSVCVWQGRIVVSIEVNGRFINLGYGDLTVAEGEEELSNTAIIENTIITFIQATGTEESSTTEIKLRFG
ncbi:hypothetical protein [Ekhidna sp.]|uniref:hypothetical protein n=1 Tax=Ekhidna sp. TaxID=2608089 RepID=UPI003299B872